MIAIDKDDRGARARPGDVIMCPKCGVEHVLIGADPPSKPSALLAYRCGEGLFLAGVDGRLLARVRR
jgi:ribosomal protein S27AE